jgi:anti-anti-sigma factor
MISLYVEDFNKVIIIHASGTLTTESLKEAEDLWNEQLDKRPEVLAFDLKGVTDIDSVSINHIFKLVKTAGKMEVKLVICDINEHLLQVFKIIRVDRVIPVMPIQNIFDEYIKKI